MSNKIDSDETRKDDAAYWAAALVLAIQNANKANERTARRALARLGYQLHRVNDVVIPELKGGGK